MPFNCPKCSAEIPAVSEEAFKARLAEVTAAKDAAEAARLSAVSALESATATAGRLSARIAGFEHDEATLSVLQLRHQASGSKVSFNDWLTADDGARTDKIAARLRAESAPPVTPSVAPPEAPAAPVVAQAAPPPPAPLASASSTVAPGPTTTPRMTADQVRQMNEPLKAQYARAKSQEERNLIKSKMDENWKLAG